MLHIFCKNTGTYMDFQEGTTLLEMLPYFEFEKPFPIISAKVNNVSQGLKFRVYNNRDVEFVDATSPCAMRVYTRSLFFLLFSCALAAELVMYKGVFFIGVILLISSGIKYIGRWKACRIS